ncbi:hypothetical protein AMTR_s00082p00071250 [Amborella trichopoda]|uniref:Uncharacterized protein n=1 Tax=Amborella trichopoda TaxID=13333 RepID=W1NU29_AMBTC|nr:hypothetical protein AMTR_s00082p00071250 [Amborella trichopoda]
MEMVTREHDRRRWLRGCTWSRWSCSHGRRLRWSRGRMEMISREHGGGCEGAPGASGRAVIGDG